MIENVVTVLGSVIIATGGAVAIFRPVAQRPQINNERPNTTVTTERFLKVENKLNAFEDEACRIDDEIKVARARQDTAVDGIYSELHALRKEFNQSIMDLRNLG